MFQVTSNGNSVRHSRNSTADVNAVLVKAGIINILNLNLSNNNAAARFFKLYDKASAPNVCVDIPVAVIPIPATGFVPVDVGSYGIRLDAGFAYAITGAITDADATAIGAGEVKVHAAFTG